MSNVDLSTECYLQMITTQRGFQANSRIITTSDTMLEELDKFETVNSMKHTGSA